MSRSLPNVLPTRISGTTAEPEPEPASVPVDASATWPASPDAASAAVVGDELPHAARTRNVNASFMRRDARERAWSRWSDHRDVGSPRTSLAHEDDRAPRLSRRLR